MLSLTVNKVFCVAALVAASLTANFSHARPLDDVIESGFISVFVYSDYAPYSWEDNGVAKGIDVDIAEAFGRELGVDVRLLIRGADENVDDDLRVNIWKGDLIHRKAADVMLHVPVDKELNARNDLAVITAPYFQEEMAVVADKAILPSVATFGYFSTHKIAAELDTISDFFLSAAFGGKLRTNVVRGRTFDIAAGHYLDGTVPALMASRAQVEWLARQAENRDSHIVQPPMPGIAKGGWPIGIAVKFDSRDLGYALGDVLTSLIDSGELAEICAKYGVSFHQPNL